MNKNMSGGEGGIRTHVTGNTCKTIFETAAFNHSATSPATACSPMVSEQNKARNELISPHLPALGHRIIKTFVIYALRSALFL